MAEGSTRRIDLKADTGALDLEGFEWVGEPPSPFLSHFSAPKKTTYCLQCGEWVVPSDSKILWATNMFRCLRGVFDKEKGAPKSIPVLCDICGGDTETIPEGYMGVNRWYWWNSVLVPVNASLGVVTKFLSTISGRINNGQTCQCVFTGRAGRGKSYAMLKLSQILEPFFSIDQVVFTRADFARCVNTLPAKRIICVDETSYVSGKRSWQNPEQQKLMLLWESMRFTLLPVFSAVINISLLDKTLRDYLVVFQVDLRRRGEARCYELHPHPIENTVGVERIQTMFFEIPDWNFCKKPSCLLPACKNLKVCPLLRGRYEMKKHRIQRARYKAIEASSATTAKTLVDWLEDFLPVYDKCTIDSGGGKTRAHVELVELELSCTHTTARRICALVRYRSREQIQEYIARAKEKRL